MKEVTIQDIADEARVSKATVSRVLNNTTAVHPDKRQAVLKATNRLGFKPNPVARSLASGRSMTIGVLTQILGSPLYDAIARGIVTEMGTTKYSPVFVDGQFKREAEILGIRAILGRRVDGLVVIGGSLPSDELAELCHGVPTVLVARELSPQQHHCIFVDNVQGGYHATKHLIDLGHRSIAMIRGVADHADAIDRVAGYKKALQEAGIQVRPELILDGDFTADSGAVAINKLCATKQSFTAVFASNDQMAFGARLSLDRHGLKVPDDISLVGFDDQSESAFMVPPFTTVEQPAFKMGTLASTAIVALIKGKVFQTQRLEATLRTRESTSAPNG